MVFKKRYIVLGLLALEVIALPVSAHIVHKQVANFDKSAVTNPQRAINVKLNSGPGESLFMVSANAPFTVTSENAIGTLDVNVYESGSLNGKNFGANAQLPGAASACAATESPKQKTIYVSQRGTIAQKGDILSKAVLVGIKYDPSLNPEIKILTQKKSVKLLPAPLCDKPEMSKS